MKKSSIYSLCLSIALITSCQQTNGINVSKNDNLEVQKNIENKYLNDVNSDFLNKNNEIFYLLNNDILLQDKLFAEHRFPATLLVYNNCLSIHTFNSGITYTLVVPEINEVLFDDDKKVIGLMNKKTKRKILIGEKIGLDSSKMVEPISSKKTVPKECSQNLILTTEIS